MAFYVAQAARELEEQCWHCISTRTEEVLGSEYWMETSLRHVRLILEMPHLTVPEISIFRALQHWASGQDQALLDSPCRIGGRKEEKTINMLLGLVRFPSMTVEQIQWEVVPSQMLSYKDIQQLLMYKTSNQVVKQSIVRFVAEPREGYEDEDLPPSHFSTDSKLRSSHCLYKPQEGDVIDTHLAAQLRAASLRHATDRHASAINPMLSTSADIHYPHNRGHGRVSDPEPSDFEYVKPGSYMYQKDRHIRMWLQDGEVMVRDASRPPTGYDVSGKRRRPGSRHNEGSRSARLANAGKALSVTHPASLSCFI